MLKGIIAITAVIGGLTVGVAPAQAQLAPTKASQLVTLAAAGAACPVTGWENFTAVNLRLTSAGTVEPFSGPPERQVLVITDIELRAFAPAGSDVSFDLRRFASPTSFSPVAIAGGTSGPAPFNLHISRGAAVEPGVALCVCARVPPATACVGQNAFVHGFLAPDK